MNVVSFWALSDGSRILSVSGSVLSQANAHDGRYGRRYHRHGGLRGARQLTLSVVTTAGQSGVRALSAV
jgi:hypothetical protein